MKNKMIKIIRVSVLLVPFLFSGCTYFGLYTEKQVKEVTSQSQEVGFDEGRSNEIRHAEHARQKELAEKQSKVKFYKVHVPAHTNADGIKVDEHYIPIRIVTE